MRAALLRTFILAPALLVASTVHAGMIVVDNLSQPVGGGAGITGGVGPNGVESMATQFTVGPGVWEINSITIRLQELTLNNPDRVVFRILSDAAGTPGATVFGAFSATTNVTADGNYSFTSTSPVILTGGTSYWLGGFGTAFEAVYAWRTALSPVDNGILGWSIGNTSRKRINAGPWELYDTNPTTFRIEATQAVPEPTSFVLLGLGAIGVVAAGRRRRYSGSRT